MAFGVLEVLDSKDTEELRTFTSGAALAAGDVVYLASGVLQVCTTAVPIGIVKNAVTASGSDVLVNVNPNVEFLMDNDNTGTTFAATHIGASFDLTGTTGAMQVDTSTAADLSAEANKKVVTCTGYNPQIDPFQSDTSVGRYKFANHVLGQ